MDYIRQIPELAALLTNADHADVKVVESDKSLRQFVADMVSYQPAWITFLYRVRAVFVRFLGLKQEGIPQRRRNHPDEVPMTPGLKLAFFTLRAAPEDAYLAVAAEPLGSGRTRVHVLTVVHYHTWAGPVYFNVIRPFHHLVVDTMARAGAKSAP